MELNLPESGDALKLTLPTGAVAPVPEVSVTVAVHVVVLSAGIEIGEHLISVVVWSMRLPGLLLNLTSIGGCGRLPDCPAPTAVQVEVFVPGLQGSG